MKMKEKKKTLDDELDDLGSSDEVKISQETEFHALANALKDDSIDEEGFSTSDQNSNLHPREVPVLLSVNYIFKKMDRGSNSPTREFKRLKKSMGGFMVNKLVESKKAENDQQSGQPMFRKLFGSMGAINNQ